jgi:hypothetical protein
VLGQIREERGFSSAGRGVEGTVEGGAGGQSCHVYVGELLWYPVGSHGEMHLGLIVQWNTAATTVL